MIEEIRIKDFVIIDKLTVSLKRGFNVLTGETGAGKSIIVDALGTLLKEKVSPTDFIRHGKNEAVIEIVLSDEFSQDEEGLYIVRRILSNQGKSRAYINDSACTVQSLAKFLNQYINIHGQHEHTSLLKRENHLVLFDNMAGLTKEVSIYRELYERLRDLNEEVEKLKKEVEGSKQILELYRFQLDEIKKAQLNEEEEKILYEKRQILRNILKLKELAEEAFYILYSDRNSVQSALSKVRANLDTISKMDSKALEIKGFIENAYVHLEEAIIALRRLKESYESDPYSLERIEERLNLIEKLKVKYGSTVKDILEYAKKIENSINSISTTDEHLKEKERQLKELNQEVFSLAERISKMRREKAVEIEREIIEELKFLGFSNPKFEIIISSTHLGSNGIDDLEFYFSANPDEPAKPLNKVASGGELSRLMLALKCVELKLAKEKLKSLALIFDEIDAGIGGKVAENVGKRLKELSSHHQVLCITHLPQIAIFADYHLKVDKVISDNKTRVIVSELSDESRKEEIARMLSGRITETALYHAEELLESK